MQFGVHLPQISWEGEPLALDRLIAVATAAERLGFGTVSANDHLVYGRPWLDGPSALAAVMAAAPAVRLMTSTSLPVVRGPFALAKTLGAIDVLSGGRLDAGLGPGSSAADYAAAGIPFTERWGRFDEAVASDACTLGRRRATLRRALLRHDRRHPVATSSAAEGTADLDRELGVDGGPAPRGPARRRLARVGLQHHPRGVRVGAETAQRHARGGGARSIDLPVRHGHDLAVRHG